MSARCAGRERTSSLISLALFLLIGACAFLDARAADRSVHARRTEERIVLDGILEEEAWRAAQAATDFVQAEPRQGEPSTERPEDRPTTGQTEVERVMALKYTYALRF